MASWKIANKEKLNSKHVSPPGGRAASSFQRDRACQNNARVLIGRRWARDFTADFRGWCVFAGSDARLRLGEAWMRLSSPWLTDTQLPQTADPQSLWPRLHRWASWTSALLSEWSTTRKDDNSASDLTVSNASGDGGRQGRRTNHRALAC